MIEDRNNDTTENQTQNVFHDALNRLYHEKPAKLKRKTGKNTITELAADIKRLLKKGFTIIEISNALRNAGAEYSQTTLNVYISAIKKKMATKKKRPTTKVEGRKMEKVEASGGTEEERNTGLDNRKDIDGDIKIASQDKTSLNQPESNGNIKISSDEI